MLQLAGGLAYLNSGFLHQSRSRGQLRIDGGEILEGLQRAAYARMGGALIAFIELRERIPCALREAAVVRKPGALLKELIELARRKFKRVQFAHLMAQQLQSCVAIPRAAFELKRAVQKLKPNAMGNADLTR